jgi:hypothetical protein
MSDSAQNIPVPMPVTPVLNPLAQPAADSQISPPPVHANNNNQAAILMDAVMANHAANTATPATAIGGRRKEVLATPLPSAETLSPTTEALPIVETPVVPEQSGNQPAEYESAQAELEPTIEKLQAEIEQNKMKAPEQIAVRQDNAEQVLPKTVAQPVVILPLTEQKMQEGEKKSPNFSVRWLVAWAKRQVKKFKDILVVYRDSSYNQDK